MSEVGGRPRVQIEGDKVRMLQFWCAMQKSVQLKIGEICCPNQSQQIVHHAVVDKTFSPAAGTTNGINPVRPMSRTLFFVEEKPFDSFRIPFEADRPVFQVWEQHLGDSDVVIDHVALCETDGGIKNLVKVSHFYLPPAGF